MKDLDCQIDDRFYTLNHAIAKNKKGNDEKAEKEISEISGAIADIKDAVESEKVQRESGSEQIVMKIQTELEKLEEEVLIDQKVIFFTRKIGISAREDPKANFSIRNLDFWLSLILG
jgi:hypothetical protein